MSKANDDTSTDATTHTAVIYLRVSSVGQITGADADGLSIKAQREACLKQARTLNATVIEEYVDKAESARSSRRPKLQAMLADLKTTPADYVIVHKLDRLARNRGDDVAINMAIREANASLISCTENIDETPSGMLMHGMLASFAEFYSMNLASEIKKGVDQKLKAGGTPKSAPLGYLNVRETTDDGREIRTIGLDPERAPHLKWAFEQYAGGGETLKSIQMQLDERGLRTRPTPKRPSKVVSTSGVQYFLRNKYYVGTITWKGVEYDGAHPHLIDQTTFDRVQHILDSNRHGDSGSRVWKHKHYLRGMLTCGKCGSGMGFTKAQGRNAKYDYFFCLGRVNRDNGCKQKYVSAELIERTVEQEYSKISINRRSLQQLADLIRKGFQLIQATDTEQAELQKRRIVKIDRQAAKLLELHYYDTIDPELFRSEQNRLRSEKHQAQAQLEAAGVKTVDMEKKLDFAVKVLTDCHRMYTTADGTIRRQFNAELFDTFAIDDEDLAAVKSEIYEALTAPDLIAALTDELDELRDSEDDQDDPNGGSGTTATSGTSRAKRQKTKNRTANRGQCGSRILELVGVVGIEPTTKTL